jgi:hypothetical protein
VVLVLGIARLACVDRGAFSLPDETRYSRALVMFEALRHGEFRLACADLAEVHARPLAVVLWLIPAAGQTLLAEVGIPFGDPLSLRVPTTFNVIVSLLLSLALYRLALRLLDGRSLAALACVAVHGLLANSNLYLRHLFPYDMALLLLLLALLQAARPQLALRGALFAGALAALGFTCYPGYYMLVPVAAALVLVGPTSAEIRRRLPLLASFAAGALAVLLLFEGLFRLGGNSYVAQAGALSGTVNQGSYSEGFTFGLKYLLANELPIGPVLIALGALHVGATLRAPRDPARRLRPETVVLGAALLAYLAHACMVQFAQSMVFVGRLLHGYAPFLVLAAVAAVYRFPQRLQRPLLLTLVSLAAVGALRFGHGFTRLGYPRDVLYELQVNTSGFDPGQWVHESSPCSLFHSPPGCGEFVPRGRLRLVNACLQSFYYDSDFRPHELPAGARVLWRGPHFQSFPAYWFEEFTIEMRHKLAERRYELIVYELP